MRAPPCIYHALNERHSRLPARPNDSQPYIKSMHAVMRMQASIVELTHTHTGTSSRTRTSDLDLCRLVGEARSDYMHIHAGITYVNKRVRVGIDTYV